MLVKLHLRQKRYLFGMEGFIITTWNTKDFEHRTAVKVYRPSEFPEAESND